MLIVKSIFATALVWFCAGVIAQDRSSGDWNVIKSVLGLQIANVKSGENTTGVVCYLDKQVCEAYVALGNSCDDGGKYPLLLNTPTGAFPLVATCRHLSPTMKILVIEEFGQMISAFESGGEIGFATPMKNGQFKVVRFSTVGATAALKDARSLPSQVSPNTTPATRKSEYL